MTFDAAWLKKGIIVYATITPVDWAVVELFLEVKWVGDKKVGVAGFEPTASSSRTTRATGLRYTPLKNTRKNTLFFGKPAAMKIYFGLLFCNLHFMSCLLLGQKFQLFCKFQVGQYNFELAVTVFFAQHFAGRQKLWVLGFNEIF